MARKRHKKIYKNNNISGEASALRGENFYSFGAFTQTYTLDSSKVNYSLARQIYGNTHDKYKLGAGFAKPIINSVVGFMGMPIFNSTGGDDEELDRVNNILDNPESDEEIVFSEDLKQKFFDDFINKEDGVFQQIHKNTLRDGDCYLLVTKKDTDSPLYGSNELIFDYRFIEPASIFCIYNSFNESIISKAVITTKINYTDENKHFVSYKITETWTEAEHSIIYTDKQNITYLEDVIESNPYGFVPIVKFSNEKDFSQNGYSELEPIEPYIRAYNDVMLDYLRTSRLTAQPKLLVKVKDVQGFLSNNFTSQEISSKKLSLASKNVVMLGDTEDNANYLEVSATTHFTLLEFLFMCIVDASETPEFVFGTAVASSKASVSEQIIPILKKVERKRASFKPAYDLLIRMLIAYNNIFRTEYGKLDFSYSISWKEIDRDDDQTRANTIKLLVDSYISAIDSGIMSKESAIESLTTFIETMSGAKKELLKIKAESKDNDNNNNNESLIDEVLNKLNNQNLEGGEAQEQDDNVIPIKNNTGGVNG